MAKPNIHEIVTDQLIAALEQGTVPWRKPWTSYGLQTSLTTGRTYRGINFLILETIQASKGYELPLWGTFKQAKALGGSVRKGERGTPVVLWKPLERETEAGQTEKFMMMRYFTVFNTAQMDDVEIPEKYLVKREPVPVLDGLDIALNYSGGPVVSHLQQDRAFYDPRKDAIVLPKLEQFESAESYAATALHEVVHSTGHPDRLDRIKLEGSQPFGCEGYAKEELVAEIGSAMLATQLNIRVDWDQTASYITGWLKRLQDDRKLIIEAAQKAQRAMDHILSVDPVVSEDLREAVA